MSDDLPVWDGDDLAGITPDLSGVPERDGDEPDDADLVEEGQS